jgi:hypothetical protein
MIQNKNKKKPREKQIQNFLKIIRESFFGKKQRKKNYNCTQKKSFNTFSKNIIRKRQSQKKNPFFYFSKAFYCLRRLLPPFNGGTDVE